ncbi:MAG: gfo/Idh/MocA family oxidoreductase, partial [Bacteroidota bacterium]
PQEKPSLPEHISTEEWDLFIGPADFMAYHPLFHPFKWRGWWNFGTGALGDMGCHLIDPPFRVLGLGYPTEVECSVGQVFTRDWTPEFIPEGCPPSSQIQLSFSATERNPRPLKMNWSDGGLRPFHPDLIPAEDPLGNSDSSNGVLMIGEKGIMTCGVYGRNPKVYLNSGEKLSLLKDYDGGLAYANEPEHGHHRYWTEAIKAGYGSEAHRALSSGFDYAGPLTEAVLMGNLAIRSYTSLVKGKGGRREFFGRQKLLWDGENMKVTNLKEANQFVSRDYRKGWKLD